MTITSENRRVQYAGNGSTTGFAYNFRILDDDDLLVVLQGASGSDTVQTKTTHYTVSGVGDAGGGTVTMVTAPAVGETLSLIVDTPVTQSTDYTTGGGFPAQSHEDTLDNLTNALKRAHDLIGRSVHLQDGDLTNGGKLDGLGAQLNNLTNGAATTDAATIANVNALIASAVLSPSGSDLINALGAGYELASHHYQIDALGATAELLQTRLTDSPTVRDFGAVGDGSTSDTVAFQAAVSDAHANGATIIVPDGTYIVDLSALTYGAKVIDWVFTPGAVCQAVAGTDHFKGPHIHYADGTNGATENVTVTPANGEQVDILRVYGSNEATGTGNMSALRFDLTANGSGSESVRGVIGAVRNASGGSGQVKAINVTAVDLNTTSGAGALICYESTITPTAQTSGARIFSGSISASSAGNVVEGMHLYGNGNAWKNGIVFEHGDVLGSGSGDNPAWIQASMGTGGASDSWFAKWKNNAGTVLAGVYNAGQTLVQSVRFGNLTTGPLDVAGSGTPESVVTAPVGSTYRRTDGGASTSFYVKESGTGNTGWVAK